MQYILRKFRPLCWLLLFLLVGEAIPFSYARAADKVEIANIHFEVVGNIVNIYYTLKGPVDGEYAVTIVLKRESSLFERTPITVSGDIGEVEGSGMTKKITWNILRDIPQGLEGEDYYFHVRVELIPPTSHTWLYITGGAIVLGGTAALLFLGSQSKEESVVNQDYPSPPGRPTGN